MSDLSKDTSPVAPIGSCNFYIERKRRFCRFKPSDGQKYCAEHAGLLGVSTQALVCIQIYLPSSLPQ